VSIDATEFSAHACLPIEGPGLPLYAAGMLVLKYQKVKVREAANGNDTAELK
jgi:hypothetical protein